MRRLPMLLCGLLLLLNAACDSGPKLKTLSPGSVVLAFGDSLTHGTGAPAGESYPDVLSGLLGLTVVNAGIPGEVSSEGRRRLPKLLAKHRPDLVILCHGGNDFLQRLERQGTIDNLRAMIDEIRGSGADVVLVAVPELGLFVEPPAFYVELAEEYGLPAEREILSDLLTDRSLKSDTIHPNAQGYRLMAEALHELIMDAQ